MADIQLDSVTNALSTGVFDKLMSAVNTHIEAQYLNNRITGSDYANVYLGSMQAVLQQSMQYVMQELLTEAQIDGIAADNLLKAKQLEIAEQELLIKQQDLLIRAEELALKITESNRLRDTTEAELEKQWGYDITRDINGDLVLGASTGLGKIDKDINIAERGMVEQEATGTKQRLIMDKDVAIKTYENTILQPDQHNTNLAQQTLLATEEEAKQYEVDFILPEQVTKLQEEIDLLQTQELSVSSDNYSKTAQVEAELRKQWGYNVTNTAGNLTLGTSTDTGRVDIETKIIEQKVVGKRQSTVIAE